VSNLDRTPGLSRLGGRAEVAARPVHEVYAGREVLLGESTRVRRLLPNLGRRLVGPWCFVDHYGPDDVAAGPGMQVPPHPHIGLQTVSWLLTGEVHHRDSLGSDQLIRPGELGLMTSGRAIAHAEQSPVPHPALLHGVQLWVALPDAHRDVAPSWAHHAELPIVTDTGVTTTVIMGSVADAVSGTVDVDGVSVAPGSMLYLGCGRRDLRLHSAPGARVLLLGGEPFDEQIVMWWNFVARTNEEIAAARTAWAEGDRFGVVVGYDGDPLAAPPLPAGRLKPGGRIR
jgi:quercetin 2,3-dioxygenase